MKTQGKKFGFKYKARSYDEIKRRANETGANYDKYIVDGLPEFKPKEGANHIRILPSTWGDAEHYGFNIFLHYNIGPDKQAYLSLDKMHGEPDPIEEERRLAAAKGQNEYAKEIAPRKRVLMWIIDRNNQSDGPKIWSCPWTLDRDITLLSFDEMNKTALLVDDPVEGRDINVKRIGTGISTEYVPLISHSDSELHANPKVVKEWLQMITNNPLPECLKYYDYSYIEKIFHGVKVSDREDALVVEDDDNDEEVSATDTPPDDYDTSEVDVEKEEVVDVEDDDGDFEVERIKQRLSKSQEHRHRTR